MKTSQIEVWMDETPLVPNGLRGLWVVPQPTAVNFSQAAAFCERATSLVNLRLLRPGVRGQGQQAYFAIPSVDEFYIADRRGMMTHGLRQAMLDSGGFLLRLNNPFWTIDVPSSRDLFRLTLLAGPLSLMIDTVYGGLSQYVYRFHDQLGASLPDDRDHLNYSTCAAWVDSRFF